MKAANIQWLMVWNREAAMRFLTHGTTEGLPPKLKLHLEELEAASANGDIKATREILDRCLGRPLQNVELNMTDRKLIADDTSARPQLTPGTPLANASYRLIEHEKMAK